MNPITRRKLYEHGYILFRTDDSSDNPLIKFSRSHGVWQKFKTYTSKSERDRDLLRIVREHKNYLIDG